MAAAEGGAAAKEPMEAGGRAAWTATVVVARAAVGMEAEAKAAEARVEGSEEGATA